MSSIGLIAVDKKNDNAKKIKLYKDSNGNNKGDALVTYLDPSAAESAIEWFNNKEFLGNILKVEIAYGGSNKKFYITYFIFNKL